MHPRSRAGHVYMIVDRDGHMLAHSALGQEMHELLGANPFYRPQPPADILPVSSRHFQSTQCSIVNAYVACHPANHIVDGCVSMQHSLALHVQSSYRSVSAIGSNAS